MTFKTRKVICCSDEYQSDIQALKQNNRLICQFATTEVLPKKKRSSPPPPTYNPIK